MITPEYKELLQELHKNEAWGNTVKVPKLVQKAINENDIKSLLDFGCGKGAALDSIKILYPNLELFGYDPAMRDIPMPDKVDMIMSMDVLEHIEPELLDETLLDLKSRTNKVQCHLIACHKARAMLPDGRNAHLIIKTPDWWQRKLRELGFEILYEDLTGQITSNPKKGYVSQAEVKYYCIVK